MGALDALKSDNLLRHAIFINAEVRWLQVGYELMRFLQDDTYIDVHLGHIDAQREVLQAGGIFHLWLRRRWGHIRLLCLLGNGNRAIVARRAPGIGRRLIRLLRRVRRRRARRLLAPCRMKALEQAGCASRAGNSL